MLCFSSKLKPQLLLTCFGGDPNEERETAGSLAALGMTTRKATATTTAKQRATKEDSRYFSPL
jgi:hypothetical protein